MARKKYYLIVSSTPSLLLEDPISFLLSLSDFPSHPSFHTSFSPPSSLPSSSFSSRLLPPLLHSLFSRYSSLHPISLSLSLSCFRPLDLSPLLSSTSLFLSSTSCSRMTRNYAIKPELKRNYAIKPELKRSPRRNADVPIKAITTRRMVMMMNWIQANAMDALSWLQ